ncbi:MAG: hypothetical protein QMD11_02760 [Smithella sp.]|nr:hypothetical protein [Smithella sp.]
MTRKKENRGGPRKGAGRPKKEPKEYSDEFKNTLFNALRRKARKMKKNFGDVFAELLYDRKTQDTTKAGLFKILGEISVIKESRRTVTNEDKRPVILLPGLQRKPEEIVEKEHEFNQN